jgi:hypothetical protein
MKLCERGRFCTFAERVSKALASANLKKQRLKVALHICTIVHRSARHQGIHSSERIVAVMCVVRHSVNIAVLLDFGVYIVVTISIPVLYVGVHISVMLSQLVKPSQHK